MNYQSFREVVVPSNPSPRWKEIVANTGASVSSLQDIIIPDSCGGYSYLDSGISQSVVRNRFIYWRTSNDILELVEQSLDLNLIGSQVRFKFQDSQIFGGVTIKELHGHVVILVSTVASVHRLIFPHPSRIQRTDLGHVTKDPVPSIFYDANLMTATDAKNMHMLNPGGSITSHLHSAATYLSSEGEALFAFSSQVGNITVIKMPPPGIQGVIQQYDLQQSSMMQKLWSGFLRSGQEASDSATSLVIHPYHGETYIFTVCRDHKLRIWSEKTRQCVQAFNLLECCPDSRSLQGQAVMGNGHIIKKVNDENGELKFCIYLNFTDRNQFCFVQPRILSGRMDIYHNATVFGISEDLIDFSATKDYLWTLWTNQTGESVARVRSMSGYVKGDSWVEVILQSTESSDIMVPPHSDPREIYMSRIFHPRRFNLQDIQKALNVYRRSLDITSVVDTGTMDVYTLQEEVTLAVEDAIRLAAAANELEEEEYCQIQLDQWTKFHSCCVQYEEVGAKMKGLFTDPMTGLVCFIKKGGVSYVRPCDKIEELYLGCGQWSKNADQYELDQARRFDVMTVGQCLNMIHSKITEDSAAQMEYSIIMHEDVKCLAVQMVEEFIYTSGLMEGSISTDSIGALLQTVGDLKGAIETILRAVDLSQEEDSPMDESDPQPDMTCQGLFTSSTAVEVIASTLYQISSTRLSALRDLLILQIIACRLGDKDGVTHEVVAALDHDLIPDTVTMIQSYVVLKWISECLATSNPTNALDFNVRQLATLELGENSVLSCPRKTDVENTGLAELFIDGIGGTNARVMLSETRLMEESGAAWTTGILGITKFIARLLWPMNSNFLFPEFLVGSCQYLHLQEYVRLLSNWCECHAASRRFLLGLSYLHFDEPKKAAQCFREAKEGVSTEEFLKHKLLQTDEVNVYRLEVLYYLKVLKQIEEFGAPDVVHALASDAITLAEDDDPNKATLYSKVFKYQLELGHNSEAYTAMIRNPDPSRRKDCLRQFLVTLCERGQLRSLIEFPYVGMEEEVVSILENKARAVDMMTHKYYDLLYAFHVFKNNFRKAGTIVYEHGMRLGRDIQGKKGLERQAQCYLAALNALRLVRPEYAWIVKPVTSQKLKSGNLAKDQEQPVPQKMEILELRDIEKEYILVDARLRLINRDTDPALSTGPTPGPVEIIGLLVKAGLFDRALIVANTFDLQLFTVFENLALRCVNLARSSTWDDSVISGAWDWLQENNLPMPNTKDVSATDAAWKLLQQYLETYEDGTAQYHKCTVIKLLSHSFPLPTWLVNAYKGLNMAELLKLYIDFDMLEEAVILTMEYVDAVMDSFTGQGSEQFRVKGCLQHKSRTCWLPYTYIDQLTSSLSDNQNDILYGQMLECLTEKLAQYDKKVQEISENLCYKPGID